MTTEQLQKLEDRVRTVLEAPFSLTNAELSRRLGWTRESVRRIRVGILHPNILPDLPRQERERTQKCWQCALANRNRRFNGGYHGEFHLWCSLGYPESVDPIYAVECPAFTRMARQSHPQSGSTPC